MKTAQQKLDSITHRHNVFIALYSKCTELQRFRLLTLNLKREKKRLIKKQTA